jgi:hypothetical protein
MCELCEVCEPVDSLEVENLTEASPPISCKPWVIADGVIARWAEQL